MQIFLLCSYKTSNFILCYPKYRYWRGEIKLASDLRRMLETGALAHLWSVYFPYESMVSSKRQNYMGPAEDEPIGLDALYLVIALATANFTLAFTTFLCEYCLCKGKKLSIKRCPCCLYLIYFYIILFI